MLLLQKTINLSVGQMHYDSVSLVSYIKTLTVIQNNVRHFTTNYLFVCFFLKPQIV
jgi:hypothetical protein